LKTIFSVIAAYFGKIFLKDLIVSLRAYAVGLFFLIEINISSNLWHNVAIIQDIFLLSNLSDNKSNSY